MKITKFGFQEFTVSSEDFVMTNEDIVELVSEEQDNLEVAEVLEVEIQAPVLSQEEMYKSAYDAAKLDVEKQMMAQNQELEARLSDIRKLIVDIERQQDTRFSELYKSMATFLNSILKKVVSNAKYASMISDTVMGYVSDIITKIKGSSLISIKLPEGMSAAVKEKISAMFESVSSEVKLDVKDHSEDSIKMEWADGSAEIDVDAPMKRLDEEIKKLDLIG